MDGTFRKSSEIDMSPIFQIESDGSVRDTNTSDNIVIAYASSTVTITINNVQCPYEGFYGVSVDGGNGWTGRAEGRLLVTG